MILKAPQEFDILDDDANIYKQIGPVLLKQDKTEAVMSVNGRLEFINKEMCVHILYNRRSRCTDRVYWAVHG